MNTKPTEVVKKRIDEIKNLIASHESSLVNIKIYDDMWSYARINTKIKELVKLLRFNERLYANITAS